MKRFIGMIMVMIMSIMLSEPMAAKASEESVYDGIREKMILYGMPEQIVEELPDSLILKYANINEESVKTYYYKVTEVENQGQVNVNNSNFAH